MPLFFMLSGAVLALKPLDSFDNIVRKKARRLLVPYFLWGWFFMFPIKWLTGFYDKTTIVQAFKGFFRGVDAGHLWFLLALFWCILLFTAIVKLLQKLGINSLYAPLLLCGAIQFLGAEALAVNIPGLAPGASGEESALFYIFYFALGYVFERERQAAHKPWKTWQAACVFAALVVLELVDRPRVPLLGTVSAALAGAAMTWLAAVLCDRLLAGWTKRRWWDCVVRNLFYVYLIHDPLERLMLKPMMEHNWLSTGFGCVMYLLCRTVGVFCLSVLLGECIQQIKKRVLRPRGSAAA